MLSGANTVSSQFEKVMVHSASQIVPIPIIVCLNVGMMCPVVRKVWTSWGIVVSAVPEERAIWFFDVPTCTFGAVTLVLVMGASGA